MAIGIAIGRPLPGHPRALVSALNAECRPPAGAVLQFQTTAGQMAADENTVFVARDEDRAAGQRCDRVFDHPDCGRSTFYEMAL